MEILEDIAGKLKKVRRESGKSQAEFAKLIGVSQRTWSAYEMGETRPKLALLIALEAKGYSVPGFTSPVRDMIESGQISEEEVREKMTYAQTLPPDMDINEGSKAVDAHWRQLKNVTGGMVIGSNADSDVHLFKFSYGKPIAIEAHDADPNALVMIPVYSQRASAGPGQPPTQMSEIEAYIPVVYEALGGAHPRNCGIVRVLGDSMTDMNLFSGDLVIFDRSQLEGDGVYVISIGGDVRIKRLEHRVFEKKLIIRSENQKRYPDPEIISIEDAQELLVVHGKVISWIHKHPY